LLPGESRTVRIRFANQAADIGQTQLLVDGWNIERQKFAGQPANDSSGKIENQGDR
jgi:hypothetical protein